MSWTATRAAIATLLEARSFTASPDTFSIDKAPASISDKLICIQIDELRPNSQMEDKQDRFFPLRLVKVSAIYETFDASQAAYDGAIDANDGLVQTIVDPGSRAPEVRLVSFIGSKYRRFKDQDNWLIVDNVFQMEITLTYPPA